MEEKSETTADQPRTDQEEDTCSLKQPQGKGKKASHADALMNSVPEHQGKTNDEDAHTQEIIPRVLTAQGCFHSSVSLETPAQAHQGLKSSTTLEWRTLQHCFLSAFKF